VERGQADGSGAPAEVVEPDGSFSRPRRSPVTLYLDTSSLVKLYVEEIGSDDVRGLVEQAEVVATSIVAYAETRAALARLRRDGHLSPAGLAGAKRTFEDQWPAFLTLDVTGSVSREAGELAERYALRGFDAVHLASFAEIARSAAPAETRFSSFDDRLNKASRAVARRLRLPS
jgi:predicted nucleic acid-binding protein